MGRLVDVICCADCIKVGTKGLDEKEISFIKDVCEKYSKPGDYGYGFGIEDKVMIISNPDLHIIYELTRKFTLRML